MSWIGRAEPSPAEQRVADRAVAQIQRRFGQISYARVDLLGGPDGSPVVLEVELVDPMLSLTDFPPAAVALALAVARRIRSERA